MNLSIPNNSVFLTGKVCKELTYSHEAYSEGFYETEIEVLRLSQQSDIIPITISDRLLRVNPIDIGSCINLHGQFRSYNRSVDGIPRLMLTVFVRDYHLTDDSEHNPNQIEITGYICKLPIFRETPFKREICDILVAVNRAYNKSDYIPCIAWGRSARFTATLPVGSRVSIMGRIQSRQYEKMYSDGTSIKRIAYEISITRITLIDEDGAFKYVPFNKSTELKPNELDVSQECASAECCASDDSSYNTDSLKACETIDTCDKQENQ